MNEIIRQIPLYRFLKYCNETDMERIYEGEKKRQGYVDYILKKK